MNPRGRSLLVAMAAGLVACSSSGDSAVDGGTSDSAVDGGTSDSTVDGGTSDSTVVFRDIALQSAITKVQPMTGIVLWEDAWGSDPIKTSDEYIQLEYAYVRPNSIVSARSTYDWTAFDALLDRIAGRQHQAIVRFYYVYPGRTTAVPQYIKNLPTYQETEGTSEGQSTWFPDWTSSELESFHLEFYSELAGRYDTDPRVAFLQVGFGLWAEYHIYDGPNTVGEQFPSKAFQATFFAHLQSVFSRLHWSISIDAGDDYYSPFDSTPSLLNIPFGNFDDSFMHEQHSGYNESMWVFFGHQSRYQHSPHGGELSYYTSYDQRHVLDVQGMHGRTYEELSATFHISYMIGNDQPSYQSAERIRNAGMANGYQFSVTAFSASEHQSRVTVQNDGIAPIYYDAFVTVNGRRASESLKGLLPGQSRQYVAPAGGSAPTLSIACDRLVAGQQIQFAADL